MKLFPSGRTLSFTHNFPKDSVTLAPTRYVKRLKSRSDSVSRNNVFKSSSEVCSNARSASSYTITRSFEGTTSPSRINFGKCSGVVIATSVCNFNPYFASSSSRIQPIFTPFGPLYLNIFFNPDSSVCVFLVLPPTSSYNSKAVCTPNSLLGTTINARGFFTSVPDFPMELIAAPIAMVFLPPTCCLPCPLTVGEVCTATRANKSSAASPISSSDFTRILCRVKRDSLKVESMGTR
mmetsp:Transcript_4357/g.8374  ORF Transcript_4357/g.8374 Transcript_4357/m.8374 type:complete len:236 (-) Transcript_4357:829-1536(-)